MKILLVSHCFPPENVIGAIRVGRTAEYFYKRGHDVRVIAAPPKADASLPLRLPEKLISYATDRMIDERFDRITSFVPFRRKRAVTPAPALERGAAEPSGRACADDWRARLRQHYYAALQIPDARGGWRPDAVAAGRKLLNQWRAEVIIASGPPVTSLFVAAALAREFRIPWAAEFRDLWTENPYYSFPNWRRSIDRFLERRLLRDASLLVTVTPLWADVLKRHFAAPVAVVLNGYDEDTLPQEASPTRAPGELSIVYTGNIYQGFRDPSPLFAAITKLKPEAREWVKVHFYGASVAQVRALSEHYGIADQVDIHGPVPYLDSLRLQQEADVLLLLQWNNPGDAGNIPAKFFEYVAAGRPILFLGYEEGTLASIIRERNGGSVTNSPDAIAAQLSTWIEMRKSGPVQPLDAQAKNGLSRTEQLEILEEKLREIANFGAEPAKASRRS